MDGDLLGITAGDFEPSFLNNFWGDRHHGYEVLHTSLKNAPGATREISDFVSAVASAEDTFARSLCRLGKQEKSNVTHILLSPIWRVLKSCVEKTGAAHLELASKLNELSKEIKRYADEDLKDRHRPHKRKFHATADATDRIQQASAALVKCRDNRTRLESSSSTGQKYENRLKKANEDMKKTVENYNGVLETFESSFEETSKILRELETKHVTKMGTFLKTIQKAQDSCNVMDRQINSTFDHAITTETSPEYVLKQFSLHRGTGNLRPAREQIESFIGEKSSKIKVSKSPSRNPSTLSAGDAKKSPKSPKKSFVDNRLRVDDGDSLAAKSQSSGGSISSEVVVQRTGDIGGKSSASKLTNIFRSAPKAPPSESGAKITEKDDESASESENDSRDHLRIGSENDDKDSPSVDDEGYTIPKPERKNSYGSKFIKTRENISQ